MNVLKQDHGNSWHLYNSDCVLAMQGIPANSVHLSVFSPPYSSIYTYSNSPQDLGNSKNDAEFYTHFRFVIDELFRIMMQGRIVAVDCMNLPAMKSRDGYLGLKDFRGDLIRLFQSSGFIFHSEHCIWKDPLIEATRTKALGLMHKQLCKDSASCRSGIPQYLLAFRKPGDNPERVSHEHGLDYFIGDDAPNRGVLSNERWRRYASPVWVDINFGNTLNAQAARDDEDERHICPMSLDIIGRVIHLWSNKNDIVFDPFSGVGSTVYQAVLQGRRGIGIELKESYFNAAVKNCRNAETRMNGASLFDGAEL